MGVFVLDASATLSWCFKDEKSDRSDALLARLKSGDNAVVPQHWPVEVANTFLVAMRRGRIDKDTVVRLFRDLLVLPIRIDPASREATFGQIFAYAERYRLTVYDAAYLELAFREGIALATFDDDLRNAARSAGVTLA